MKKPQIYDILEDGYFGENPHEAGELGELPALANGQTVFLDVGASLGQYTRQFREIAGGNNRFLVEVHSWSDRKAGKSPKDIFGIFYTHGYDMKKPAIISSFFRETPDPGNCAAGTIRLRRSCGISSSDLHCTSP